MNKALDVTSPIAFCGGVIYGVTSKNLKIFCASNWMRVHGPQRPRCCVRPVSAD